MNDTQTKGRKKTKPKSELKETRITIRLTDEEYSKIVADMERCGYDSISTFIREKALDTAIDVVERNSPELLNETGKIYRELNKQGININNMRIKLFQIMEKSSVNNSMISLSQELEKYKNKLQDMKNEVEKLNDKLIT